ncbi:hypothetical protein HZB02_05220 [Candidatus Woesearchaeota archaeon]|nr:hypothetical protein [Candidatus Woesearchaeota archaeon]
MDIAKLRTSLLSATKAAIRSSVKEDNLIIQCVNSMQETEKCINMMSKRLREWYGLSLPEVEHSVEDHETLINTVLTKSREELLKQYHITEPMGPELSNKDVTTINELAATIQQLFALKQKQEEYLNVSMKSYYPELEKTAGSIVGAKLLAKAGSIKHLMEMPSSTIQILGAEKALFRHLTRSSRPPKHGIILQHQKVAGAKEKGKAARQLANAIAKAVKIDYFKKEKA